MRLPARCAGAVSTATGPIIRHTVRPSPYCPRVRWAIELPDAIEPNQLKTAAVAGMVILAFLAFIAMRFVQKVVTKLILLAILVAGGVFLYNQRDDLDECQKQLRASFGLDCTCGFAGFDVTVPGCEALRDRAED